MKDDEDIESIAAAVEEGRDGYELPQELVEEPVSEKPLVKNLQARIATMNVGERLKLAITGNRDARTILIRDSNRMIQRFVLQNQRITDDEVIAISRNRNAERELIEIISKRKEWISNYQVRLALVTNPKTPVAIAMRYVSSLLQRDLRQLAKSKNVPSAVNALAKRLVIERTSGTTGPRGGA